MSPEAVLEQYFGYQAFRPGQKEIVASVVAGHDTLALLATGGGKSLCFQVPGLVLGGTTVVISPLISLMKDQVDALEKKSIKATFINSALSSEEQQKRLTKFRQGKYDFVYLSPEKLQSRPIIELANQISIKLVVIDEAHCISEWGHDFRPEYRLIIKFVKQLPQRPVVMAVTATATKHVRQDICRVLRLQKPQIFVNTFRRPTLAFLVLNCPTQTSQILMLHLLLHKHRGEAGIIYAATREMTERLAKLINNFDFHHHFSVQAYHGGLTNEQRSTIQEAFIANKIQIITATNAFGMGVDKSNVRFVIHFHFPASLEHYYQEAGRAGRDQKAANCYVLFNPAGVQIHRAFIKESAQPKRQSINLQKLQAVLSFAQKHQCRTKTLLAYFDEKTTFKKCDACDICLNSKWSLSSDQQSYQEKIATWRSGLCQRYQLHATQILPRSSEKYLALLQPATFTQLTKIPGLGTGWQRKWAKNFGETFFLPNQTSKN